MQKYIRYKKQNEKDQNTIEFSCTLYRESLEDSAFDENEY